jgi:uracil phosphoribosyltransferase
MRQGIYTVLRDKTTSRQDWIFFVDRVSTFLVEKALEHVPYRSKTVVTPTGCEAHGKELDVSVRASCISPSTLTSDVVLSVCAQCRSYEREALPAHLACY